MAKIESFVCDIKKCPTPATELGKSIQVIFTTEQTEGRGCKPYLSVHTLDLCTGCMNRLLDGNYIYGSGAMGYNDFTFKTEK